MEKKKNAVEVCFSPKLFPDIITNENYIVVISDILRATTSMCVAFEHGVKEIIPVAGLDEIKRMKEDGYLIAAERDGQALDFADFGNSAFNFMTPVVKDKTIAYSTTNGTQAIEMAAKTADGVVIGSFINLDAVVDYLFEQDKNVVILCSGWKNRFSLEDAFYAGALIDRLMLNDDFSMDCDASTAALDLWHTGQEDIHYYIEKAEHRNRLKRLGQDDVIELTFSLNISRVVPVLVEGKLIDISKSI
ncbi:MAG: 2-phosphosulfolactate phosphatase [Bacteroidales bacterium]|nr:2-phosphosulfolactate phosphatase [Bacteroidales bacterium]